MTIEDRADKYLQSRGLFRGACASQISYGANCMYAGYIQGDTDRKDIYDKRIEELLQYLEELEAHYHDLGQYDDGKPIRRVIEYIKTMEE